MGITFSRSKWLAYTFFVGLTPIFTRLLTWAITNQGAVVMVSASDFVAFGLVLHISIINELEHVPVSERDWKTIQNGTSLVFIVLYGGLCVISVIGEKAKDIVNISGLLICSIVLCLVSTALSFSVFHRLSRLNPA